MAANYELAPLERVDGGVMDPATHKVEVTWDGEPRPPFLRRGEILVLEGEKWTIDETAYHPPGDGTGEKLVYEVKKGSRW